MKLFQNFCRFWNPKVDPDVLRHTDRQSMRNIFYVAISILVIEAVLLINFLISRAGHFDRNAVISLVSVGYCILMCLLLSVISKRMLKNASLKHSTFVAMKIFFFLAFAAWAIFVDYRHYRTGTQMLTSFAVCLGVVCFVHFKPWVGAVLNLGAYAGWFAALYAFDGAKNIEVLNFIVLALVSVIANATLYHNQLYLFSKQDRLQDDNALLEKASRTDALTGLQNRLALEEHATTVSGRHLTAYMIDINYFKEINDQYGHLAGDALLKQTSEELKHLFPNARYYRYGGDEFLVMTYRDAVENYGGQTYDFTGSKSGIKVSLSIGSAQGNPRNYDEVFELIGEADRSLYVVKKRTHSVEFGGHDRRKNR